jgi:hypothetical protein
VLNYFLSQSPSNEIQPIESQENDAPHPYMRAHEIDDQMERYSETSSIELVIQGGPIEQQQLNSSAPRVPESHMMNFNPYPGVKNYSHVPIDILKSFTPVAHAEQQQQQVNHASSEIYDEYATNPYNLTLQIDSDIGEQHSSSSKLVTGTSTFFQSSNYFSNDSNEIIPPGSELFNRP